MRRFGDRPIEKGVLEMMLCELEKRGNDAAGICIVNGAELNIYKADTTPWNLTCRGEWDEFLAEHLKPETDVVLLHTRKWTKGNPRKNSNNHPLHNGIAAIIHNGSIQNDDDTFRTLGLKREAEVDSDIFRAIVDKWSLTDAAVRQIGRLRGSAAVAAVDPRMPGHLMLLRSGSPIVTASTADGWFLWASTKDALYKALRPYVQRHGLDFQMPLPEGTAFGAFPDHSVMIMQPDGRAAWHREVKICPFYNKPDYSVCVQQYKPRQERATREQQQDDRKAGVQRPEEPPDFAKCGHCGRYNDIEANEKEVPMWKLGCGECGKPLAERPKGGQ